MLGVILKILSILGIILLILLAILLLVLLLVLFMPIVYKADGEKTESDLKASFSAQWLFGFIRVNYNYPTPGKIIIKILWITVFDSSQKRVSENPAQTIEKDAPDEAAGENIQNESVTATEEQARETINENINPESEPEMKKTLKDKLFEKYEKIKYTIQRFYDKIKHIRENISFYKKLLENEQTQELFSHVCKRLGKVLRHIRPRKIKANILYGADSPDTTGYVYAIYGMFSPQLGKDVCITPDFTQKILLGNVYLAGYITVFKLLINALAVLLDRRLHLLIRRLKKHSAKMAKETGNITVRNA